MRDAQPGGFRPQALRALQSSLWPDNVRGLENQVHRLVLSVAQGSGSGVATSRAAFATGIRSCPRSRSIASLERVEIALIRQRLQAKPTTSAAARSLGITREALYAKNAAPRHGNARRVSGTPS